MVVVNQICYNAGVGVLQRKINVSWSENFAYAIGIIASDGCLSKDKRHFWLSSKDLEIIKKFKRSLSLKNRIGRYARGGEKEKRYFYISFGDAYFYKFLNKIGLTSAKSKTIKAVRTPHKYFPDFLRGLFDGDGTFYTFWDKRWPRSFSFKLSFASASIDFVIWLKEKLTECFGVRGYIHKGDGVYNLEYVKGDSKKLFKVMYHDKNILCFSKKYHKIKTALKQDEKFGLSILQKQRKLG